MAGSRTAGIRICVLGTPAVRGPEGPIRLPVKPANVLLALALAGESGRHGRWLRRTVWSDLEGDDLSVVTTAIHDLRKRGVSIPKPADGAPYVLGHDRAEIDCHRFVDLVDALPSPASPAQLDEPFELWDANPWERPTQLPTTCWSVVRAALDRLVQRVGELDDAGRTELRRWNTFEQLLAGDPITERLRPAVPRAGKRKVLIVDDQIGQQISDVLSDFDSEVVGSIGAWNRRVAKGTPLGHVCALVDLHLKSEMVDRGGVQVIADLRRLSSMPIVLFSAALPAFEDYEDLRRRYGVSKVMAKHNDPNGDLQPIGRIVEELVALRAAR